jgi:hypothetical protein
MKSKKLAVIALFVFLAAWLSYQLIFKQKMIVSDNGTSKKGYMFSDTIKSDQSLSGKLISKKLDINDGEISSDTINEFEFLSHEFRDAESKEMHLAMVRAFLLEKYEAGYAEMIFQSYKKWLECSIALTEEFSGHRPSGSAGEIIAYLEKIYEFQKERLGETLAAKFYLKDLNKKIFHIKRSSIIYNDELYGSEKEALISDLDKSAREDDILSDSVEPYNLYREKITIFKRDLDEADEDKKKELMNSIRESTLSPETSEAMRAVSQNQKIAREKESRYLSEKAAIMKDHSLSENEKKQKTADIQQTIFGQAGAAARQRIEKIETGYQEIAKKLN